ncbi:MAG: hypothetical protein ACP5I4_14455, partial [Oceanipulchritudo sp.]
WLGARGERQLPTGNSEKPFLKARSDAIRSFSCRNLPDAIHEGFPFMCKNEFILENCTIRI